MITIFEALIIGAVGSFLANITDPLLVYLKVDDAVGATCVHGFGGLWGVIAVGLFAGRSQYIQLKNWRVVLYDNLRS